MFEEMPVLQVFFWNFRTPVRCFFSKITLILAK